MHTNFQNDLKAHFTRLLVRMMLCLVAEIFPTHLLLATSFTTTVTGDGNVNLQGDVLVQSPSSVVNVNLLNNSLLTGAMQKVNDVTVQTGSTWDMTNSSTVNGNVLISNVGTLMFDGPKKFAATGEASVLSIGGNYTMDS